MTWMHKRRCERRLRIAPRSLPPQSSSTPADTVRLNQSEQERSNETDRSLSIASDAASAAGGNPTISCFDELWGYTSERSRRLWDK